MDVPYNRQISLCLYILTFLNTDHDTFYIHINETYMKCLSHGEHCQCDIKFIWSNKGYIREHQFNLKGGGAVVFLGVTFFRDKLWRHYFFPTNIFRIFFSVHVRDRKLFLHQMLKKQTTIAPHHLQVKWTVPKRYIG